MVWEKEEQNEKENMMIIIYIIKDQAQPKICFSIKKDTRLVLKSDILLKPTNYDFSNDIT
jgi:hypothetical protein